MKLSSSHLLVLATTLTTCTYASPTPPTLTLNQPGTASNLSINSLGNPFECWHATMYHSRRADFGDCAGVIALLPNLDAHRVFSTGSDPHTDPYSLPRIETFGPCRVSIRMADRGSRDESSWDAVDVAALKVVEACAMGNGNGAKTGGESMAGTGGGIRIDVEHVR